MLETQGSAELRAGPGGSGVTWLSGSQGQMHPHKLLSDPYMSTSRRPPENAAFVHYSAKRSLDHRIELCGFRASQGLNTE